MKSEAIRAADALSRALQVEVDFAEHAFAVDHYSAGTPAQRAADLMTAFRDPTIRAVVLSMGGATAIDVLDLIDYDVVRSNPKILAGISDSTTVLAAVTTHTGLVTFHGLELLDLARHPMPYTLASARATWFDAWSGLWAPNPGWRDLDGEVTTYTGWRTIRPGTVEGRLMGGNSEAITQLIGGRHSPDFDDAILVLETYRLQKRHIHALLVSLRQRGILDTINGMIIGYCLGSDAPGGGNDRDLADIVAETTTGHDIPVVQIGEIGHQVENLILPLGARARLQASPGGPALSLLDPAVA
jgi:muramoyltetrapeptide carboxypeptidase